MVARARLAAASCRAARWRERRRAGGVREGACLGGEARAQAVHARAGADADADGAGRDAAAEVDFVGEQERGGGWNGSTYSPSLKGRGRSCVTVGRLLHHDHQIRGRRTRAGATDTLRLDRIGRLAQPSGVDQRHGDPAQHHARFQGIPGGSGRLRHDRHISLGQRVHQTGLADIRGAGDREHEALAQPLPAPSVV
jgi:hypothetical protein